jgi:hypothetical protein
MPGSGPGMTRLESVRQCYAVGVLALFGMRLV